MYNVFKVFVLYSFSLFSIIAALFAVIFFLWVIKREKAVKVLVAFTFLYVIILSLPFFANIMLGSLESQYPKFSTENYHGNTADIKFIVVLSGGHTLDEKLPLTSQFSYAELVRLIEGLRLYCEKPGMKLILSGGRGDDPLSDAEIMARLSMILGIPKKDIILESGSSNTYDQAIMVKPLVGNAKFLLVTSASHMPRSMALFGKQGMDPIAAPTDHMIKRPHKKWLLFIPNIYNFIKVDIAFYEYFGLIKEKILGRI